MKGWRKNMKVFISWSGPTSLKVAQIFREWLPSVIQSIEPYVSSEDIDKGARWSTDIATELADSTFGILCVTKDNLEAPWLSFEAGALSKTMEKSFVTPFLFDIKRSEVKGPILQFQSTIFDKDDIKKMLKTLNKASGENGISDMRLDNYFDVWYPTLENKLNDLKKEVVSVEGQTKEQDYDHSSEILEEILELSRDNQKLLRTPDIKLYDDIASVKDSIEKVSINSSMIYEQRKMGRKYNPMFFEDVYHIFKKSSYGFLVALSLFKEEFPWVYDMGKELIEFINSDKSNDEKLNHIREYKELIEITYNHPLMRDYYGRNKNSVVLMKEIPYFLFRYIDDMMEQYN